MDRKYAMLIDGDNIAVKYMEDVINELSSIGTLTIKRVYGDFKNPRLKDWEKASLKYSIIPVQQYENTKGKNSTDMCMAIDAMDILHSNEVDGFCIVSSDSDFTRLAARLREAGKEVIGMGNRNTVEAFMAACSTFKKLENLGENDEETGDDADFEQIEKEVYDIMLECEDDVMEASALKDTLVRRNPGFDVKDYGFSKFSAFLRSMDNLELTDRFRKVSLKSTKEDDVRRIITALIERGTYTTNQLNLAITRKIPGFNLKSLGYSSWKSYLKNNGFRIDGRQHVKKALS
ncbi:MAG: NYN domain-containing protein [Anaerovoracaceae bacterium]